MLDTGCTHTTGTKRVGRCSGSTSNNNNHVIRILSTRRHSQIRKEDRSPSIFTCSEQTIVWIESLVPRNGKMCDLINASQPRGAGRSSEVERSLMVRWVVGSILHGVDPLSYFSFQPVLHNWFNKGRGMCYPVCGMVHIK